MAKSQQLAEQLLFRLFAASSTVNDNLTDIDNLCDDIIVALSGDLTYPKQAKRYAKRIKQIIKHIQTNKSAMSI